MVLQLSHPQAKKDYMNCLLAPWIVAWDNLAGNLDNLDAKISAFYDNFRKIPVVHKEFFLY